MWRIYIFLKKLNSFIFWIMGHFLRKFVEPAGTHLPYSLWDMKVNTQGQLVIGDCTVKELSQTYGTPLFVVDERRLRNNYRTFCRAFQSAYPEVEVYYSYKTNPVPEVLHILHEEGAGAEVISPYELWLALKLGVPPSRIIYNGVYKDATSLEMAVKQDIRLINIDSFGEIERLADIARRMGKRPTVGVRVSTGIGWSSQFGLQIQSGEALKAYQLMAELDCFHICGIHTHLGTSILKVSEYRQASREIVRFLKRLKDELNLEIRDVDIGGGFGVSTVRSLWDIDRYMAYPSLPDVDRAPSLQQFSQAIAETISNDCKQYGLSNPRLVLEPGRIISSGSQTLLLSVAAIKKQPDGSQYLIADGGLNLAYPLKWEYHEIYVANRMQEPYRETYSIVGPLCTPTDLLYHSKLLPSVSEGDTLAVMDAGAYFVSYMNTFSFPRPAIVLVSEGRHRLIRRAETFEEIPSLDNFFLGKE